jgi:ankyrin repeat protein
MSGIVASTSPPNLETKTSTICNHQYLILWTDTWHCCDCKAEIIDPQRIANEEKLAQDVELEDNARKQESSEYSHLLGVTVDWLIEFTEDNSCWDLPTWKVQHTIIKPATENTRCRYCDLLPNATNKLHQAVGPSDIFISHCWGSKFGDLVAAIADSCDGKQRVWIDIFAVRQWPGNIADLDFAGIVARCHSVLLICVHLESIANLTWFDISGNVTVPKVARCSVPFFRVWCLVELQAAQSSNKPIIMKGGNRDPSSVYPNIRFVPSYDMLSKMEYLVDVEKAEATVEADKIRILQQVRASPGGSIGLNRSVQASIVAARLSCKYKIVTQAAIGNKNAIQSIREGTTNENVNHLIVAAAGGGYVKLFHDLLNVGGKIEPNDDELPTFCYTKTTNENGGEMETVTCLMAASRSGNEKMVAEIIQLGGNVNRQNTRHYTPLMCASKFGHTNVVRLLLENGASVDAKESLFGKTSLALCALHPNNVQCIDLLCENGANIDSIDHHGRTPLDSALIQNIKDSSYQLIKHRMSMPFKKMVCDHEGHNALFHAVRYADYEIVKYLFDRSKVDPNIIANDGTSPLMLAVDTEGFGNGRENIIVLLLESGAVVETKDHDGETALTLAKEWGNEKVVNLLQKYLREEEKEEGKEEKTAAAAAVV